MSKPKEKIRLWPDFIQYIYTKKKKVREHRCIHCGKPVGETLYNLGCCDECLKSVAGIVVERR